MRACAITVIVLGLMLTAGCQEVLAPPAGRATLQGPFLGQKPPGTTPTLFAPGVVSTGMLERDIAMTPDGDELYFTRVLGSYTFSAILGSRQVGGIWSEPEVAPFSGRYFDLEPHISPNGARFFFVSRRPSPGTTAPTDNEEIWVMDREGDHWGEPFPVGEPVNSGAAEFFPSTTVDGTLYFTRETPDGEKIHRARWTGEGWAEPEVLPEQVNFGRARFNAFVAPDESYLIVCAVGGPGDLGGADYYAVFRSADDRWSDPVNLGPDINTADPRAGEWSAFVTADGHTMFFMSSRTEIQDRTVPQALDAAALAKRHDEPQNGYADIWWVDASVVTSLRPDGF
jgi:hypothetical protein